MLYVEHEHFALELELKEQFSSNFNAIPGDNLLKYILDLIFVRAIRDFQLVYHFRS